MKKNGELCNYIFWGAVSTVLNVGMSWFLVFVGLNYKISNVITLITVKAFCYVTNKLFVFKTPFGSIGIFIKELCSFILARWVTFLVDYFGVVFLVDVLGWTFFLSKCLLSAVVIVLNYVLSKWMVFRTDKENFEKHGYDGSKKGADYRY